ncbi:MAG: radical SAM protein [Oscillospiraceae bacterium]|nr:radical SAM protein [Oscillospiraceae bacterium]
MKKEPTFPLVSLSRLRMGTDGAGVTTLVIGMGCPLRCRYCINDFTWEPDCSATAVTVKKMYDLVKKDDLYFQATGGGITFGGGEPLLHAAFIRDFSKVCRNKWNITVETSLNVPEQNLQIAIECVDDFIVDIKDMNPQIYQRYTGGNNARVIGGVKLLLQNLGPERVLIRVPHIPEINTPENVTRSIAQLRELGVERIDEFSYVIP